MQGHTLLSVYKHTYFLPRTITVFHQRSHTMSSRRRDCVLLSPAEYRTAKKSGASTPTSDDTTEVVDVLAIPILRDLAAKLLKSRMHCNVVTVSDTFL
jgi:hypothetical protein